jgi:hypothetical protein
MNNGHSTPEVNKNPFIIMNYVRHSVGYSILCTKCPPEIFCLEVFKILTDERIFLLKFLDLLLLNKHKFEFWKREFQKSVKIIISSGVIYMILSWSGFLFWIHPKKREILPLPRACGSELAPIHTSYLNAASH